MDSKKFIKELMLGVSAKNKKTQLQSDFFEMLVCKNQENQPFLNVFQAVGNNFEEKKLGKIFGIIQVLDFSENSEYLPNLLAQVIKKEFYRYPKEGTEQCFENALHKANLALADLARHDIIQWIGKLDAIVGVIFEDSIFLSQAGEGKAFLVRDKKFLEITQSIDENEVHPMKTFSEILSGKIQPEDKLIFTTKEVFKFLKKDEIKRHSKVFNPHEFDNLIRSSLELEADNSGMIIANLSEKEIYQYNEPEEKEMPEDINFFGSQKKKSQKKEVRKDEKPVEENTPEEQHPIPEEPNEKEDSLSFNSEFYIKEDFEEPDSEGKKASEKISAGKIFGKIKNTCFICGKKTSDYLKNIDYSKLKNIRLKKEHQTKIKGFFKKIWRFAVIGKDKIKIRIILLKKKLHARKEEKERKKRLNRI